VDKYGGIFMKLRKLLLALAIILGLTSCGVNGSGNGTGNGSEIGPGSETESSSENIGSEGCNDGVCGGDVELNLDAINDYFKNDPNWKDLNTMGNKMALIPFTHINGPRAEWNFFAFVNFQFNARRYYKYQVTYLSCTCRPASVNYWQTAYVELTSPKSGDVNDVKLQMLSFDKDDTGHYNAGFWGDSGVNGHDINGSGITYEDIKTGFIPFLVGKTYKELSSYDNFEADGTTYDDTVWGIP
jgi:hypothetical protein